MFEPRNMENDIDKLPTAPEHPRIAPSDPHDIIAMVQQHIALMAGQMIEPILVLEQLTRICLQLRYVGQRNYKLVIHEYSQAVEVYPDNAYVHFSLGTIHQQLGNFDKAVNAYNLALCESSLEVIARYNAARCLLYQGLSDDAIQQLSQALRKVRQTSTGTESLEDRIWTARPRKESGENGTPEKEILKLIEKAEERIKRQSQKQTLLPLKQTAPTQSTAEAPQEIPAIPSEGALSEDAPPSVQPDELRVHDDLAGMYVQRGFLDDALAELHLLTIIYLRRKQLREAGATIRRISKIYAQVGDVEEALTNLRHAADLMPGEVDLLREIVDYCLQLGMRKDATQYLMVIARHYFDHRQFNEAVAVLQLLITYDAKNYEAYDLLGQIYQLEGKFEQASGVYRRLARLHNESSIAWERQATLQELRTKKPE